ncbi:response regulator transcription factor [Paenibacillus jamilae]|uniref:response regulator n=1 Tax=Paenibacillus jamilae TaxID=114136 RepID=UPI003D26B90C
MYKVFIVDDEPFIIEGLYDIVDWTSFGLEIVGHAENGSLALEALASRPVDVLITDISMPTMDGLRLIDEARKLHADLKTIILSGFNEFDYLKEGMKLGIENYLLKPINVEELESTLCNTTEKLDRSRLDQQYETLGVQVLKENMLYRWLTGQIAPTEFQERAELIGFSLNIPFMGVAVLRTEGNLAGMHQQLRQYIQHQPDLTLFRDVDEVSVIIAALPNYDESRQDLITLLEDFSVQWSTEGDETVYIGIGSVGSLAAAPRSYNEAKKSLEYFMIYDDRRIIDYTMLEEDKDNAGQTCSIDWKDYAKLIIARDLDVLTARIQSDFEQFQHLERVTPNELRNMALELVIRFKMELESIKHSNESERFQQGLHQIKYCTTWAELVSALQDVATETVNSLLQDMKNPIVSQVLSYIHVHYAKELSLKILGYQYNLHPVYLGQLFHKETGETFAEYINQYRIKKAKEQLKNTNLKVNEIARNVGYWETGYFYKQFRKYVGISPTDYKGLG